MKCKNCGANYASSEERCPYCNTVGERSKWFSYHKNAAQRQYRNAKKNMEPMLHRYSVNTVLNRVIVIEVILFVVYFVFVIFFVQMNFGYGSYSNSAKGMTKKECKAEIKRLYEAQEFDKMTKLYYDSDIYSDDGMELYYSMASYYYGYESFQEYRIEFLNEIKEDDIDDNTINNLLYCMNGILRKNTYTYLEQADEANKKYFDEYEKDVKAFALGIMGLTENEIELLSTSYMSDDMEKQLRKSVKARRIQFGTETESE